MFIVREPVEERVKLCEVPVKCLMCGVQIGWNNISNYDTWRTVICLNCKEQSKKPLEVTELPPSILAPAKEWKEYLMNLPPPQRFAFLERITTVDMIKEKILDPNLKRINDTNLDAF